MQSNDLTDKHALFDFPARELYVAVQSNHPGQDITPAETLILTCQVEGGTGYYSYQWSSNCSGNCFVTNQTSMTVVREGLRSTDSGNHTCTVDDDAGNSGDGSVLINVKGKVSCLYAVEVCMFGQEHALKVHI